MNNNIKLIQQNNIKNIIDKCINNVYTIVGGRYKMEVKIQKWGNSDGIRIPSSILKALNLKTNDKLELKQEEDKIIITKINKKKITLKERFEKYNDLNVSKEFKWDEPKGKEIW